VTFGSSKLTEAKVPMRERGVCDRFAPAEIVIRVHKSLHKNEPAYPDKSNGCRLPHV